MVLRFTVPALAAALGLAALSPRPAEACGGCFVPPSDSTVVSGHRMALSISTTQTVLWDQIQYAGDPAEFAWVLPVKKGARVELSTDAFFEVLDAGTTTEVRGFAPSCGSDFDGPSCASSDEGFAGGRAEAGPDVTVVHRGTVGPYETVTLASDTQGALSDWLAGHNYNVDPSSRPVIDAYVAEGFDFVALRLQPGRGVREMKPVRVVTPGASPALPLRMVAVGSGAEVGVVLFVIAEGRYASANFPSVAVQESLLSWDFLNQTSNYAELREQALATDGGRGWLTTMAKPEGLFDFSDSGGQFGGGGFQIGANFASTIAEAYFLQGQSNGEETLPCDAQPNAFLGEGRKIVEGCADDDPECAPPGPDEVHASELRCGKLDDLATALVGMRPKDVWLTRLEASLPREVLTTDLELEPHPSQERQSNVLQARIRVNEEEACERAGLPPPASRGLGRGGPLGTVFAFAAAGAVMLAVGRRASRLRAAGRA